ncbi:sulfatase-like hydrolase/transferase [Nocardioides sp. TF02-7]|uniref:sulfatase-like hydrolase/transferase n=1 Tax=Nocardioides sp. TF02-7 TaxID=2917724 RepID=UPI001F06CC9F|nr:sulfatase-like hydrolase/transferase [Nocardioides sp. TF02-7]UMG91885.1 sulfatase-like hydrolase/transferase [Nocardioides sp. TF02-7]
MPSRKLLTAIAAPAVLTLASLAPVLGTSQASTASAGPRPADAPRPNLVFVMADDLGWADLGTGRVNGGHDNDFNETPALDRLAAEGQVFTEAYASVQCSPTRTALHTGQYGTRPTNNVYSVGAGTGSETSPLRGVTQGRPEDGRHAVPVSYPTIGETLQDAGYTTGYTGKFHVTGSVEEIVTSHGYDESWGGGPNSHATYYFATDGQFNETVAPELDQFAEDYTQEYVDENIAPYSDGVGDAQLDALVGTDKHVTDAQTDATLDFIERRKDDPFFLWVSHFAPHFPVNDAQARPDLLAKYRAKAPGDAPAKPSYAAPDRRRRPVGGPHHRLPRGDTGPAQRRQAARRQHPGHLHLGQRRRGGPGQLRRVQRPAPRRQGAGLRGRRACAVDRVEQEPRPGPGRRSRQRDDRQQHGPLPDARLVREGEAAAPGPARRRRPQAGVQPGHHDRARPLPPPAGVRRGAGPASTVRDGRWKLHYDYTDGSFELYDLARDLGETTDLAARKPGLVHHLGRQLIRWLDETNAPLATLREGQPTRVLRRFTGETYVDGRIRRHHRDTITVAAGEPVPFLLPRP